MHTHMIVLDELPFSILKHSRKFKNMIPYTYSTYACQRNLLEICFCACRRWGGPAILITWGCFPVGETPGSARWWAVACVSVPGAR